MVQAKLSYGSSVFFPALSAERMGRIIKMAKAGARAVLRLHNPVRTRPILLKLNITPIEGLYRMKLLVFVYRCINSLSSSLFSQYYLPVSEHAGATHKVTRGQESCLLRIPFLPGPAGIL